jgi:4'-phosphopantetheinyl transferase
VESVKWRVESGEWRTLAEQRAAAYRLLGELTGGEVVVEHDDKGAPYLPDHPGLSVSISHCRTAVAVAVSPEGRVGIDVECRRKIGEGLLERVCTADERAAVLASADPTMAFLQLWTRKEAVLKMRGTGIQGFGSMVDALSAEDVVVTDIPCDISDVVCSLAM